jgi:hypothetical protein
MPAGAGLPLLLSLTLLLLFLRRGRGLLARHARLHLDFVTLGQP